MTAGDWFPLAAAHPVPGDPAGVRLIAASLRGTGGTAAHQAEVLRVSAGVPCWRGAAAAEFAAVAAELPRLLQAVAARYEGAAGALDSYATALADAQRLALAALALARAAADGSAEARERWRAVHDLAVAHGARGGAAWVEASRSAGLADTDAERRLAEARRRLAEAVRLRDDAVGVAGRRLRVVADDSLRDQAAMAGWLQGAARFVTHNLHAGEVSAFLGAAAILTTPLAPISGILQAGSLAAGAVNLAAETTLAATGAPDGSWSDVRHAALGVALLGAGKVYGGAARTAGDIARAEKALATAGSSADRARAASDLAAARVAAPTRFLVPNRQQWAELRPYRVMDDIRKDAQTMTTAGVRVIARREWDDTGDALRGQHGGKVQVQTGIGLGATGGSAVLDGKTIADALRGSPGAAPGGCPEPGRPVVQAAGAQVAGAGR